MYVCVYVCVRVCMYVVRVYDTCYYKMLHNNRPVFDAVSILH